MDTFVTAHFKTLESISDNRQSHSVQILNKNASNSHKNPNLNVSKKSNESKKVQNFVTNTVTSPAVCRCFLCQGSHPIRLCPTFLSQSVDERMSAAKRLRCCTNCLTTSHNFKNCKSTHVCTLCKQRLHSFLHRETKPQEYFLSAASSQLPIATNSSQQPISSFNKNPENHPNGCITALCCKFLYPNWFR